MTTPFIPQCPPFGNFVVFMFGDHIEVVTTSPALTMLTEAAACLVDSLAEDVELVGVEVWKFTYQPNEWSWLCDCLAELYPSPPPVSSRRDFA